MAITILLDEDDQLQVVEGASRRPPKIREIECLAKHFNAALGIRIVLRRSATRKHSHIAKDIIENWPSGTTQIVVAPEEGD